MIFVPIELIRSRVYHPTLKYEGFWNHGGYLAFPEAGDVIRKPLENPKSAGMKFYGRLDDRNHASD